MAPLVHLFTLFALATAVLASPHISRNVHNHAHRAVALPAIDLDSRSPVAPPKRKRSLNKRCVPRPTTNSTTSALPTSTLPATTAPLNVAPVPSAFTPSAEPSSPPSPSPSPSSPADTTSSTPSYVTPSSTPEAPATTSTPPPPSPTTTSTPAPSSTPATTSSSSSEPSFMTGTQTGQGTFYEVGLGACGITNTDGQAIAAVSQALFDSYPGYDGVNPNTNPVCGKQITASYGGNSVVVTVYDRCTACAITDLDFSPGAFDTLAAASLGRIDISWTWKS